MRRCCRPPGPGRGLAGAPAAPGRVVLRAPTRPGCAGWSGASAPEPFDLVMDVQGLLKSAVWVALARSPRKVGYDRTREGSYLAPHRAGGPL